VSTSARETGAALVVGGSGGVGSAICEALAADFSHVLVGYHGRRERATEVAGRVRGLGAGATVVRLDVKDEHSIADAVTHAERSAGSLAAVVYAGGTRKTFDFVSRTPHEDWLAALETDVLGFLALARGTLPSLRKAHGSLVATTTYQAGRLEVKGALSSVPKAALERVVAVIAREEGRYGVRANAVRLGWIAAGSGGDMIRAGAVDASQVREIPLGRYGRAEEAAAAVAFLASRRASFITGAMLPADGGHSL